MDSACETSYTQIQKKKILATFPSHLELNVSASCKIYTSGPNGKEWLYSDLEGILAFILDYQLRTRYLTLFDNFSFEKLFQYELYNDFSKSFEKLSPDFRCFEVENGFIGLQFDLSKEANQFDLMIKKLEGKMLNSLFEAMPSSKNRDYTTEKMKVFARNLKETFCRGTNYDETYAEDGIEINKARNFEVLNNITFNRETKQFEIGEISEELRNIFIGAGIRKKDLKNDLDLAFSLFKKIILGISENKELLHNDYFHKEYSPPEFSQQKNDSDDDKEEEEEEEDTENNKTPHPKSETNNPSLQTQGDSSYQSKTNNQQKPPIPAKKNINSKIAPPKTSTSKVPSEAKNGINSQTNKTNQPNSKPQPSANSSIPLPPPLLLPIPNINPQPPTQSGSIPVPPPLIGGLLNNNNKPQMSREEELASIKLKKVTNEETEPKQLSMYEQLQNVKLKAVVKKDTALPQKLITKTEKNFLQNSLASALAQRRKNLLKHQEEDSDSDEDW